MALKAIIDKDVFDTLPADVQKEYKEQTTDGKTIYLLDVIDVDTLPTVKNLKTAHERQKEVNREIKAKLEAAEERLEGLPEDFNEEVYNDLKARAEKSGEPPKTDEQVAALRADLEKKHQKELDKLNTRIEKLTGVLNKTLVDDKITQAMAEAGIASEYFAAVKAMLKEKGIFKVVEEDDDFVARAETDMGPLPVNQFVKDWSAGDEGKVFMVKPKGGDAPGSDGRVKEPNPWMSDPGKGIKPNLTQQGAIITADKDKARRMMKEAGKTEAEINRILG